MLLHHSRATHTGNHIQRMSWKGSLGFAPIQYAACFLENRRVSCKQPVRSLDVFGIVGLACRTPLQATGHEYF